MGTPVGLGTYHQSQFACTCREGRASHAHFFGEVSDLSVRSLHRTALSLCRCLPLTPCARGLFSDQVCSGFFCHGTENLETVQIYSRTYGPKPVVNRSRSYLSDTVKALTAMDEKCYFHDKELKEHFVNASFANIIDGEDACVSNNVSERYSISDVCVLMKRQGRRRISTWNAVSARFEKKPITSQLIASSTFNTEVIRNGSFRLEVHMCDSDGCLRNMTLRRNVSAKLFCNKGFYEADSPSRFACLYASTNWRIISMFDIRAEYPAVRRDIAAPMIVYRNFDGSRPFDSFSRNDRSVLFFFRAKFAHRSLPAIDISRRLDGVALMLLLEGFGAKEDLHVIRDYRKDKPKLYTQVKLELFIPLLLVTGVLGFGAIVAALWQPKRRMVLQVAVCMEQLIRIARARETGDNLPFGPPDAELRMGTMRVDVCGEQGQMFSVNTKYSEPYDDNVPWV